MTDCFALLMAYSRGMPEAKALRNSFQHISSLGELDEIAGHSVSAAGTASCVAVS